jgi:exosortase
LDQAWLASGGLVLLAGAWAYLPTLIEMVKAWIREPDYSHGFLVVPVAIFFLCVRRARFPGLGAPDYKLGLALLGCGLLIRYLAALFFMEFLDGYSILFWLSGAVALLGGRRLWRWSLPAVAFLFFMIPLPFGIETAMSAPLQRVATKLTGLTLQTLGYPAFTEGNVIVNGDQPPLNVAEACSGLRLFMTIVALAYAYIVLVRRAWWEKAILLAAIAPIAIVSNATRIVVVGLIDWHTTWNHQAVDDSVGKFLMIPLATALFGLVLWYLSILIREDEIMDMSALVREVEP